MNIYNCEEKIGRRFPEDFRDIYIKGYMEWMTHTISWVHNHIKEIEKIDSFGLFCLGDCRFLVFEEIIKQIDEMENLLTLDMKYRNIHNSKNPIYKLIPFAKMACGDLFCFYYKNKEEIPIVVYGHDTGDFELWANSFSELIFMQIVSGVVDWEEKLEGRITQLYIHLLPKVYQEKIKKLSLEDLEKAAFQRSDFLMDCTEEIYGGNV